MARLVTVFALAAALSAVALTAGAQDQPPPPRPGDCVHHRAEARYDAYGYDHIVILDNQCDYRAVCEVSTNVNPDVQRVEVASGATKEVVTFRGSPARSFTPHVSCDRAH